MKLDAHDRCELRPKPTTDPGDDATLPNLLIGTQIPERIQSGVLKDTDEKGHQSADFSNSDWR